MPGQESGAAMGKIGPPVVWRLLGLAHRGKLVNANEPLVTFELAVELRKSIEKAVTLLIGELAVVLADAHHRGVRMNERTVRGVFMHLDDRVLVVGAGAWKGSRDD